MRSNGKNIKIIICLFIDTFCILSLLITSFANLQFANTVCLWILAYIYFGLFLYFALGTFAFNRFKQITEKANRCFVLVTTVVLSLFLFFALPFDYRTVKTNNYMSRKLLENQEITIEALGKKNSESENTYVCLEGISVDGKDYNLYEISLPDEWEFVDGRPFTDGVEDSEITIILDAVEEYGIMFQKGPQFGMVRISIGGMSGEIDLYQNEFEQRVEVSLIDLFELYSAETLTMTEEIVFSVSYMIILLALCFTGTIWMNTFIVGEKRLQKKEDGVE